MKTPKPRKGSYILYIVMLIITLAAMFSLKICSHPRSNNISIQPSGGDTIDVGIEYSPLSLYTYNDTLGGLNYDIIREIARNKSLTLKFHPVVSLTEAKRLLDNGYFDILIAEVPMTAEFKQDYLFTEPIYLDRQVLVQKKDSITGNKKVNTQLDLANKTVWAVANSPIAQRIRNLSSEIGDTIHVVADSLYTSEQLFLMVVTGEIEYAVINEALAKNMTNDYEYIDISTNISFTQFQPWITNRNDSVLCDSLNIWITDLKNKEIYRQLLLKYNKK